MRHRLLHASTGALALTLGLIFAVGMGLALYLGGRGDGVALAFAILGGGLFGPMMASYIARDREQLRQAMYAPDHPSLNQLTEELSSDEPLRDPHRRASVEGGIELLVQRLRRQRRWAEPMFLALALVATWLALTVSHAWWAACALFIAWPLLSRAQERRLVARLHALRATGSSPDRGVAP